jgi:predicted nucleotidyltransferase
MARKPHPCHEARMQLNHTRNRTREEIAEAICARADEIRQRSVTAVFIGLRARGDNRPDSDLDTFGDYDPQSEFSAPLEIAVREISSIVLAC